MSLLGGEGSIQWGPVQWGPEFGKKFREEYANQCGEIDIRGDFDISKATEYLDCSLESSTRGFGKRVVTGAMCGTLAAFGVPLSRRDVLKGMAAGLAALMVTGCRPDASGGGSMEFGRFGEGEMLSPEDLHALVYDIYNDPNHELRSDLTNMTRARFAGWITELGRMAEELNIDKDWEINVNDSSDIEAYIKYLSVLHSMVMIEEMRMEDLNLRRESFSGRLRDYFLYELQRVLESTSASKALESVKTEENPNIETLISMFYFFKAEISRYEYGEVPDIQSLLDKSEFHAAIEVMRNRDDPSVNMRSVIEGPYLKEAWRRYKQHIAEKTEDIMEEEDEVPDAFWSRLATFLERRGTLLQTEFRQIVDLAEEIPDFNFDEATIKEIKGAAFEAFRKNFSMSVYIQEKAREALGCSKIEELVSTMQEYYGDQKDYWDDWIYPELALMRLWEEGEIDENAFLELLTEKYMDLGELYNEVLQNLGNMITNNSQLMEYLTHEIYGRLPTDDISRNDVLAALEDLWNVDFEQWEFTARREMTPLAKSLTMLPWPSKITVNDEEVWARDDREGGLFAEELDINVSDKHSDKQNKIKIYVKEQGEDRVQTEFKLKPGDKCLGFEPQVMKHTGVGKDRLEIVWGARVRDEDGKIRFIYNARWDDTARGIDTKRKPIDDSGVAQGFWAKADPGALLGLRGESTLAPANMVVRARLGEMLTGKPGVIEDLYMQGLSLEYTDQRIAAIAHLICRDFVTNVEHAIGLSTPQVPLVTVQKRGFGNLAKEVVWEVISEDSILFSSLPVSLLEGPGLRGRNGIVLGPKEEPGERVGLVEVLENNTARGIFTERLLIEKMLPLWEHRTVQELAIIAALLSKESMAGPVVKSLSPVLHKIIGMYLLPIVNTDVLTLTVMKNLKSSSWENDN